MNRRIGYIGTGFAACGVLLLALSAASYPADASPSPPGAIVETAPEPGPVFRPRLVESRGYTTEVKAAIDRSLAFLAENQQANGAWRNKVGYKFNEVYSGPIADHVGTTALACLAFAASGSVPGEGKYAAQIELGLDYILENVQQSGYITDNGSRMYAHTFATLFLAEIYGMASERKRDRVREALRSAIGLIMDCQRADGGWRYTPQALDQDSDISVTVCCLQALRAAQNQGFYVRLSTINNAKAYINNLYERTGTGYRGYVGYMTPIKGSFKYQDEDSETIPYTRTSVALTAAGVTSLMSGGDYSSDMVASGINFISKYAFGRQYDHPMASLHFFYGHYYSVQAMYQKGGRLWEDYFKKLSELLVAAQERDGSWFDHDVVGRNYSTAMGCLILQITNGYLPIFQR